MAGFGELQRTRRTQRVSLLASGAGLRHGGVVKEEPPVRTKARRLGKLRWWLLALLLAWGGYAAWREYDYRAAVREAKEAGFKWVESGPWDLIRADWRNALKKQTWSTYERRLELGDIDRLTQYRDLIRRLRPMDLRASNFKDENLDALKGITRLRRLASPHCPNLQNVDALKGVTGLELIYLPGCPNLQNIDALRGHIGLKYLFIDGASKLQNVDALKNLPGLQRLELGGCDKIPLNSLDELRAALPNTKINFPLSYQELREFPPRWTGSARGR